MTYKTTETWLQDHTDSHLWHTENGLIINTEALAERKDYFDLDLIYSADAKQETWTQDEADADLWHGKNGIMLNTAALNDREGHYDIVRVLAIEPYLNMRGYDCASC